MILPLQGYFWSMKYIIAAGLLQVVLALFLLLQNIRTNKANYLLVVLLGCIGWHLATKFYIFTTIHNQAVTFRMHTFIQLAYGPLLYLYARKKNDGAFIPARLWYLFIPLIMVLTLYGCTTAGLWLYPDYSATILSTYNGIVFLPIVLSHILFGLMVRTKVLKEKDNKEYLLINTLRILVIAIGCTEIALLVTGNYDAGYNPYIRSILYILIGLIPIVITMNNRIALPSPMVLAQHGKAQLSLAYAEAHTAVTIKEKTERKPLLTTEQHREVYAKLEQLLNEKQLYRDEELSLEKLAAHMGINRHYISETLNLYAKKPFYRYINEYRIAEVIKILQEPQQKPTRLLTVAYDSGFKTKASFNQYFKAITGKTPSAYLKELKSGQ